MDAERTPEAAAPALRIEEVFPPATLTEEAAAAIAAIAAEATDARERWLSHLVREPRSRDAFLLLGLVERRIVAYAKLQRYANGEAWLRALLVDRHAAALGIDHQLIRHARSLVGLSVQLVAEVDETDLACQLQLRELGFYCLPPAERTKRQRERRLYEFRSYRPPELHFDRKPRFTWPPVWPSDAVS